MRKILFNLSNYFQRIQLTFTDFDLEDHAECAWDYVEVKDGDESTAGLLGKFCGDSAPSTLVSTGRFLFVKLKTDYLNGETGFQATFSSLKSESQEDDDSALITEKNGQ